jgi:hypothetical protein
MRKAKKIDRATQHPAQAVRNLFFLSEAKKRKMNLHDLWKTAY